MSNLPPKWARGNVLHPVYRTNQSPFERVTIEIARRRGHRSPRHLNLIPGCVWSLASPAACCTDVGRCSRAHGPFTHTWLCTQCHRQRPSSHPTGQEEKGTTGECVVSNGVAHTLYPYPCWLGFIGRVHRARATRQVILCAIVGGSKNDV